MKIISLILFVILFMITTGYAVFTQNLRIIGNISANAELIKVTFFVPATAWSNGSEYTNPTHAYTDTSNNSYRYNRTDKSNYAYTTDSGLGNTWGKFSRNITYHFQDIGNVNSYLEDGSLVNLPTDRTVTFTSCTLYATMGVWIHDNTSLTGDNRGIARITSPITFGMGEVGLIASTDGNWKSYSSPIAIPARGSTTTTTFNGQCTNKGGLNSREVRAGVTNIYLKIEAEYWPH